MRAPALRPGDSAGCSGGSGSNSYTGSRHQERTDLRADAAVHYRPVSSGAGQTLPGGQLILDVKVRQGREHMLQLGQEVLRIDWDLGRMDEGFRAVKAWMCWKSGAG